jgi:low affinity Fe/Cu permease
MENSAGRRVLSRFIHWIGEVTSRAFTAGVVIVGVIVFLVVLAINGFPSAWENTFVLIAAVITLLMVFVIQHTQNRQQVATQLKLDELIRSAPRADDLLIHVESAHDDELIALDEEGIKQHSAIRVDADSESDEVTEPTGPQ